MTWWKPLFLICGIISLSFGIFQSNLPRVIAGLGLMFLSALILKDEQVEKK